MLFETQEERDKIVKDPSFLLFVKIVKEFFQQVRRFLFLIPILVLLGFAYIYNSARTLKPTYNADITFIITQQEKSAGKSNALEELGFMGRGNKPSINFEKLKMYGYSKKIITNALFTPMRFFGRDDLCINHFMQISGYPQKQPYFQPVESVDSLSVEQMAILNGVIGTMRSSVISLSVGTADVFMVSIKSTNELFAHRFSKIYYDALREFYIETALGSSYQAYSYFRNRLDSLGGELRSTDYAIADIDDKSHNVVKMTAMVPRANLERKKESLTTSYTEALKQFELAKVDYENAAPVFIILDQPSLPLPSNAPTARNQYILTSIGAIFLFFVIVTVSMIWKYFGFIFTSFIKS